MHFADRLEKAIKSKGNPICVGLDPRFDKLPLELQKDAILKYGLTAKAMAEAFIAFNKAILDAVADRIASSLKEEPVPEEVIDSILKLLGPYRILSLATGWQEDMIKGYLRQAVRERKLKTARNNP